MFSFATRSVLTYSICSCFNLWYGEMTLPTTHPSLYANQTSQPINTPSHHHHQQHHQNHHQHHRHLHHNHHHHQPTSAQNGGNQNNNLLVNHNNNHDGIYNRTKSGFNEKASSELSGISRKEAYSSRVFLQLISNWEKFVVFFSGFRGPLSFWLSMYVAECFPYELMSPKLKQGITTAVLVAILVTTFVQGPTIKAFAACLVGNQIPLVQKSPRRVRRRKKYLSVITSSISGPLKAGLNSIIQKQSTCCRCRKKTERKVGFNRQKRQQLSMMTEQYELARKLNMMLLVDSIQSVNEKSCITDYDPLRSVGSSLISVTSTDFYPGENNGYEAEMMRRKNALQY
ncbi:uncharacterized protein LOC134854579 isoform X2 [Symsagittifera roscoffensis]|uniref:uncharacterized protein LOC134854579 isoform X2 n=1 Tax=Symsagittifera roscoffensis TaxID=84072 RepID=UPI00307C414E